MAVQDHVVLSICLHKQMERALIICSLQIALIAIPKPCETYYQKLSGYHAMLISELSRYASIIYAAPTHLKVTNIKKFNPNDGYVNGYCNIFQNTPIVVIRKDVPTDRYAFLSHE